MKRFLLIALSAGLLSPGVVSAYQNDNFSKAIKDISEVKELVCMGYEYSTIELGNPFSWFPKRSNYFLIHPSMSKEVPGLPNNFYVRVFNMARNENHSDGVWLFETKREYIAFMYKYDELKNMSIEEIIDLNKKPEFRRIKVYNLSWMKNTLEWLRNGSPKSADYCD